MTPLRSWLITPSRSRDLTALTVAVLAVFLLSGNHTALGSSTRYTESCREMVELGDWVVPHLGYVPYLEKPILTYWLGALSRVLFGGGELASQAPAALCALIAVWATYGLASRLRDRAFGLGAALLLLGSGLFLAMTSTLTTDMPLAACIAAAWYAWWRWSERVSGKCPVIGVFGFRVSGKEAGDEPTSTDPSQLPVGETHDARSEKTTHHAPRTTHATKWLWLFWLWLGLGVLAKGPIAIVLTACGVAGYALLADGWHGPFRHLWAMRPFTGLAIIAAVNLPWSILVWQRDPRLLEFFYVRINFQAFFDGSINHPGPPWYYLPVLAGSFAPFTFLALPALGLALWSAIRPQCRLQPVTPTDAAQRLRLFLAACSLFPLAFLSVSASKLGSYILPLMPVMAVMVADRIHDAGPVARRWWTGTVAAMAVLLLLVLASGPLVVMAIHEAFEANRPLGIHIGSLQWMLPDISERDMRTIDWSWLPLMQGLILLLVGGLVGALITAARGQLARSLAWLGVSFALVAACLLSFLDRDIVPDLNSARLVRELRIRGGDNPALPTTQRDVVVLHQEVVHAYDLDYELGRRAHVLDFARERGMGHFIEVHGPDIPLPDKQREHPLPGLGYTDPYDLRGENLPENPWLWSWAHLREEWNSPRRIWLIGEQGLEKQLLRHGCTDIHIIARTRKNVLLCNRPDPLTAALNPTTEP